MIFSSLRFGATALIAAVLSACGGSAGGDGPIGAATEKREASAAATSSGITENQAARFLTQATFGPTFAPSPGEAETDVAKVMRLGYSGWIDEQFTKPAFNHQATWQAIDDNLKARTPPVSAGQNGVSHAFWKSAVTADDALRQRVAFAWSQIMVISMQDSTVGFYPKAVASYYDMLADKGLGNYRDLLKAVSLHPLMGRYLSHLRNRKADPTVGRVPDQNYAREVMQLFSIGLHQLNPDGTPKKDAQGNKIDTYTQSDIEGLARVFTGWSFACGDYKSADKARRDACFYDTAVPTSAQNLDLWKNSMVGYADFHSTEEKKFLGRTIAAQTTADPDASLNEAIDTLFMHPNVGPFISKQLIQRLVTSNPSPAYVSAVSAAFNANPQGVRGDLKHVVKTILTHPDAVNLPTVTQRKTFGKVREPILRITALLRAYGYTSRSGNWSQTILTDNPGTSIGQTVMRSPSVFNFYRPGYIPPGTEAAASGLVAPEMQIYNETSAAGYVNFVRDTVSSGMGDGDIVPNFSAELALAGNAADLVNSLNRKLMYGGMSATLANTIYAAVKSIEIPPLNATGSNQAAIDSAKRNRVNAAVFLAMVSPVFIIQK